MSGGHHDGHGHDHGHNHTHDNSHDHAHDHVPGPMPDHDHDRGHDHDHGPGHHHHAPASFGAALVRPTGVETVTSLLIRVDHALERARSGGCNRVELSP